MTGQPQHVVFVLDTDNVLRRHFASTALPEHIADEERVRAVASGYRVGALLIVASEMEPFRLLDTLEVYLSVGLYPEDVRGFDHGARVRWGGGARVKWGG